MPPQANIYLAMALVISLSYGLFVIPSLAGLPNTEVEGIDEAPSNSWNLNVDQASYGAIQFGMSVTEVEAILGGKPCRQGLLLDCPKIRQFLAVFSPANGWKEWSNDYCIILVRFDQDGQVDGKIIHDESERGLVKK